MNYILLSDILWYSGHVLTGASIFFSHNYFTVSICLVCFGQFITIISRPISRLTASNNKAEYDQGITRV